MNNLYWLDSIFSYASRYRKDVDSLESQMNAISKLILFSFFFLKIFLPMKIASAITLAMLFITSIVYYYLVHTFHPPMKENYEEYTKKTNLDDLNLDFYVDSSRREVFIPSRPMNTVQYKTILPVESYSKLLQTHPNSNIQSKGNQHPLTKKNIQPRENLFSQSISESEQNIRPRSFLKVEKPILEKKQTKLNDLEIFSRTNIDHLNTSDLTPDDYYEKVDKMYFENQLLLRQNYENQIKELNRIKDAHYEFAPIHQNFRVRGAGGPSFSQNYRGPRGSR